MKVIGLTGSFGTGKSFAASVFKSLGARVLDADKIAHGTLKKGTATYKRIKAVFGRKILNAKNDIDRSKLSAVVFNDRLKLKKLVDIVHPAVIKSIRDEVKKARPNDVVVIDAPLLVEAKLVGDVDLLVVVKSSRVKQLSRVCRKTGLSKAECLKRIKNQAPLSSKVRIADFVIDNNGTRVETRLQVRRIWERLKLWK